MRNWFVVLLALLPMFAFASKDELVIVQAVSGSGRTLILNRGFAHGVNKFQESLFTTEDISIAARATEVSRHHSLWEPNDKNAVFPFQKDQTITYNSKVKNIWTDMPELRERLADARLIQEGFMQSRRPKHSFSSRLALSNTFYESISETDSERKPKRNGLSVEALYHFRHNDHMEYSAGIRYDQENAVIEDPELTIPSTRFFGIAEVTYHFDSWAGSESNLYVSVGAGIGRSQTEVDGAISSGMATLLPYVRGGAIIRSGKRLSFVIESIVESVSTSESFIDTKEQTTNLVNAKIGFGVRF